MVTPEHLPVFTGTTPKPSFYDSGEPQNHTGEKREGRRERGGGKKGLLALTIFILPTLEFLSDKKVPATHQLRHLDRAVPFSKIQVYIYLLKTGLGILDF